MAATSLRGITAGRMPKRYRRDHYSWWDVDTGFSDERAAGGAFLGNKPCSLYIPTKRTQYTKMHLGNWWSHGECDPYKYSEILRPFWLLSRQCELQLSFDIYYSLLTCVNMFWWYWSRKTDWVPRCFSSSPQKSSTGSQCHLKNSTV